MKTFLLAISTAALISSHAAAKEPAVPLRITESWPEVLKLLANGSQTRDYLQCAVVATRLDKKKTLDNVLNKLSSFTRDGPAIAFAYIYMLGYFARAEAELAKGKTESEVELLLALGFSHTCKGSIAE